MLAKSCQDLIAAKAQLTRAKDTLQEAVLKNATAEESLRDQEEELIMARLKILQVAFPQSHEVKCLGLWLMVRVGQQFTADCQNVSSCL